jgi:hypothetical protein
MRRETTEVVSAFLQGKSCHRKNSGTDGNAIYLFSNRIAWRGADGSISMTLCGHGTPTTRDRLNGLCLMLMDKKPFYQKDGVQYYDHLEISTDQIITVHTIIEHKHT